MIHLKFFLGDFFFSLSISLLKRKETCKNISTDRVQQYFLAFEDEVALGPEIFHVRFPFSEVFSILNSFMLSAFCEVNHASAVVYIKKITTQFFEVVFRPYLPGLLATLQPVKREHFASFLPLHNWRYSKEQLFDFWSFAFSSWWFYSDTHYHIINVTIITDVVTSYELVHCCRTKVIIC